MNLRQLQIFVTVTETGKMSETGRQLYMTQPAVSQTISELEEDLQIKLFDRMNRKLYLTNAGELLYNYSKKILLLVNEAKSSIEDMANMKMGRLRVGASTTIGIYLLPRIVGDFTKRYENIDSYFTIDNTGVIEEMILNNHIDIALVEGLIHSRDIIVKHFLDDELYLICSKNHRWARRKELSIDLEEITGEPLIVREKGSGTREVFEKVLDKNHLSYQPKHVLNNTEAIKKAVEADIGIAFISKLAVQEEINSGRLVKIDIKNIPITRKLNIIYHKDKYRSPLFDTFSKYIEQYAVS